MKNVKDAAITALGIVIIKLIFRLIPPWTQPRISFEYGIVIILIAYIMIFIIVLIFLIIYRRRKNKR